MIGYVEAGLFLGIMALLYLVLISRYGILAHKIRDWQTRRNRATREMAQDSESKRSSAAPPAGQNTEPPVRIHDS